jgi:hypothetical protein
VTVFWFSCSVGGGFTISAYCYITFMGDKLWFRYFTPTNMEVIYLRVQKACNLLNIYQKFGGNGVHPFQRQTSMCQKLDILTKRLFIPAFVLCCISIVKSCNGCCFCTSLQ